MKKLIVLLELVIIFLLLLPTHQAKSQTTLIIEPQKYFTMVATAYCPCEICCDQWSVNKRTFTGDKAKRGCIAIDPQARILNFGQEVWIDGYGIGMCNDIGGGIEGWEIDLCFETHQEAIDWGRQLVRVYLIN